MTVIDDPMITMYEPTPTGFMGAPDDRFKATGNHPSDWNPAGEWYREPCITTPSDAASELDRWAALSRRALQSWMAENPY